MKTAFVSGGLGFLGRNLIEQLLADQWQVTVMDRDADLLESPPEDWLESRVTLIQGDITDRDSCFIVMPDDLDCVFHIAASTSQWKRGDEMQDRINIGGTRNMVAAALAHKATRFVHTSSIAAFGFQPGPVTEQSPSTAPNARINYFRSKRKAELEVHQGIAKGLDAVILNPANIIGRYDRVSWARLFNQIADGSFKAAPPGFGSFCDAGEVARIHLRAYYDGVCGENYLLGGIDAGFSGVMAEMARLLGCPAPKPAPAWVLKILARVSYWGSLVTGKEPALTPETAELTSSTLVCDSSKAMAELGFKAVPLADMVSDSYHWLQSEGLLGNTMA